MTPLPILGALLIGVSLGLTGAGGSIITLPVLVYLAGIEPQEAVPMSLIIVGAAAATGAIQRIARGEICLPTATIFAGTGMVGAAFGARLTHLVSPETLMLIFAGLMLFVAFQMFRRSSESEEIREKSWWLKGLAGLAVGVLTGFIGVGGGFLLVPALVKFGGLGHRPAVGSSLAIIFFNCLAGFLFHLGQAPVDRKLSLLYTVLACLGVAVGSHFAAKVPTARLRQIFASMVICTGVFVLWRNLG